MSFLKKELKEYEIVSYTVDVTGGAVKVVRRIPLGEHVLPEAFQRYFECPENFFTVDGIHFFTEKHIDHLACSGVFVGRLMDPLWLPEMESEDPDPLIMLLYSGCVSEQEATNWLKEYEKVITKSQQQSFFSENGEGSSDERAVL